MSKTKLFSALLIGLFALPSFATEARVQFSYALSLNDGSETEHTMTFHSEGRRNNVGGIWDRVVLHKDPQADITSVGDFLSIYSVTANYNNAADCQYRLVHHNDHLVNRTFCLVDEKESKGNIVQTYHMYVFDGGEQSLDVRFNRLNGGYINAIHSLTNHRVPNYQKLEAYKCQFVQKASEYPRVTCENESFATGRLLDVRRR